MIPSFEYPNGLTADGYFWALEQQTNSIVARVALDPNSNWPVHYVRTAVEACNRMATDASH